MDKTPQYEPSSDEIRFMIERVEYLDSLSQLSVEEIDELMTKYNHYRFTIHCDRTLWRRKNGLSDSDEGLKQTELERVPPHELYYFKCGNIDYQQEALHSSDPWSYSLRYGNNEVIWNSFHALPDNLRATPRDILRHCNGWLPEDEVPTQEELRAWIEGKSDDKKCRKLVSVYIFTAAEKYRVKGLSPAN